MESGDAGQVSSHLYRGASLQHCDSNDTRKVGDPALQNLAGRRLSNSNEHSQEVTGFQTGLVDHDVGFLQAATVTEEGAFRYLTFVSV